MNTGSWPDKSTIEKLDNLDIALSALRDALGCVVIAGSNTLKESVATFTRPDNDTAYQALDVVSTLTGDILTFPTGLPAGSGGIILQALFKVEVDTKPDLCTGFVLRMYSTAPAAIADNVAYNLPATDLDKYIGSISIPSPEDLGDNIVAQNSSVNFPFKLADEDTNLYVICQTLGAYAPTPLVTKTITFNIAAM